MLPTMGYPDIELVDQHGRLTYLEVKISSSVKHSSLRSFYYTTGKKIKTDASHLLLEVYTELLLMAVLPL